MVSFSRSRLQKQEVWRLLAGLWGFGNVFTLALRACISDLPVDTRHKLKSRVASSSWVKPCIFQIEIFTSLSDPPISIFGFTSPDSPHRMSPDEFIATFSKFVSILCKHVNLDSKDPSQLEILRESPLLKP